MNVTFDLWSTNNIGNLLGPEGARALSAALKTNTPLKELILYGLLQHIKKDANQNDYHKEKQRMKSVAKEQGH